jgi:hypothetical protein
VDCFVRLGLFELGAFLDGSFWMFIEYELPVEIAVG